MVQPQAPIREMVERFRAQVCMDCPTSIPLHGIGISSTMSDTDISPYITIMLQCGSCGTVVTVTKKLPPLS